MDTKVRVEYIQEDPIVILDNCFNVEEIERLHKALLIANFSPLGASKKESEDYNEIMTDFNIGDYENHRLNTISDKFIREYFKTKSAHCYDVLGNLISFGDFTFIHTDTKTDKSITMLYFANSIWNNDWGAETIFYDNSEEAILPISVKPGRIVLFRSSIKHRAGVPNRNCGEPRITLSATYFIDGYKKEKATNNV